MCLSSRRDDFCTVQDNQAIILITAAENRQRLNDIFIGQDYVGAVLAIGANQRSLQNGFPAYDFAGAGRLAGEIHPLPFTRLEQSRDVDLSLRQQIGVGRVCLTFADCHAVIFVRRVEADGLIVERDAKRLDVEQVAAEHRIDARNSPGCSQSVKPVALREL
jgi:hypothetical protein